MTPPSDDWENVKDDVDDISRVPSIASSRAGLINFEIIHEIRLEGLGMLLVGFPTLGISEKAGSGDYTKRQYKKWQCLEWEGNCNYHKCSSKDSLKVLENG